MIKPLAGCRDDIGRSHHGGRQLCQNRRFETRDRVEAGMVVSPRGEIDAGPPRLVECVGSGINHARKQLDALQFAKRCFGQNCLNC